MGKVGVADVAWDGLEGFQDDILMRWPSVGRIPLQASVHESGWEGSIVAIEHHVDRCEYREGGAAAVGHSGRDDSTPEGVECRGAEDIAAAVGVKDEIVESDLCLCQTWA